MVKGTQSHIPLFRISSFSPHFVPPILPKSHTPSPTGPDPLICLSYYFKEVMSEYSPRELQLYINNLNAVLHRSVVENNLRNIVTLVIKI